MQNSTELSLFSKRRLSFSSAVGDLCVIPLKLQYDGYSKFAQAPPNDLVFYQCSAWIKPMQLGISTSFILSTWSNKFDSCGQGKTATYLNTCFPSKIQRLLFYIMIYYYSSNMNTCFPSKFKNVHFT